MSIINGVVDDFKNCPKYEEWLDGVMQGLQAGRYIVRLTPQTPGVDYCYRDIPSIETILAPELNDQIAVANMYNFMAVPGQISTFVQFSAVPCGSTVRVYSTQSSNYTDYTCAGTQPTNPADPTKVAALCCLPPPPPRPSPPPPPPNPPGVVTSPSPPPPSPPPPAPPPPSPPPPVPPPPGSSGIPTPARARFPPLPARGGKAAPPPPYVEVAFAATAAQPEIRTVEITVPVKSRSDERHIVSWFCPAFNKALTTAFGGAATFAPHPQLGAGSCTQWGLGTTGKVYLLHITGRATAAAWDALEAKISGKQGDAGAVAFVVDAQMVCESKLSFYDGAEASKGTLLSQYSPKLKRNPWKYTQKKSPYCLRGKVTQYE